jgi:hypothetical protein
VICLPGTSTDAPAYEISRLDVSALCGGFLDGDHSHLDTSPVEETLQLGE